jgi:hydrogenase maturation protease
MPLVRVIGCGNPDVGDDAAGIIAVAAARPALLRLPDVDVVERATPLQAIHLFDGARAVVLVDALREPTGGRAPGTLVRSDVGPSGVLSPDVRTSLSSHGFGIAEAVALAGVIGDRPSIVLLGVEAAVAAAGVSLSPKVSAAMPELVRSIVAEARALRSEAERRSADGSDGPLSPSVGSGR